MSLETMSCEDLLESLEEYLDAELAPAATAAFQDHLAGCPACAAEHRLAMAVRRELRALPELDTPSSVLVKVQHDLAHDLTRKRFQKPRHRPPATRHWMSLAAAVLAAAVIATGMWLEPRFREAPSTQDLATTDATEAAEIARATEEARFALAYMNQITKRASLKLRDDVLIERVAAPTVRSLTRTLTSQFGDDREADDVDDGDRS